jgi:hypothetical protein
MRTVTREEFSTIMASLVALIIFGSMCDRWLNERRQRRRLREARKERDKILGIGED